MVYTGFELLWLFFLYSFLGWLLETIYAAVRQRKFANRGMVNGPFCVSYGITALILSINLSEVSFFWLFIGSIIYATVIEWIAGHLIEKFYHEKWWDYKKRKWNLDGYICLTASLTWGVLGVAAVKFGNPFFCFLLQYVNSLIGNAALIFLSGILAVDIVASWILLRKKGKHLKEWEEANNRIIEVTRAIEKRIYGYVEKRIVKAYPSLQVIEKSQVPKERFAQGASPYKIIILFLVGAFLGDLVETVYCRFSMGQWMSRSSVVWGPFSLVWGIAVAAITGLLYKYRNYSNRFLFCIGFLLGGAYEFFCSVFTEIVFGRIFWDYSGIPFNLGGRINLLFCLFWGLASIVWFKKVLPLVEKWIEMMPGKIGKPLVWACAAFMICNIFVSGLALIRYNERGEGKIATKQWQIWFDDSYNDIIMERIYPNAKIPGSDSQ